MSFKTEIKIYILSINLNEIQWENSVFPQNKQKTQGNL